MTGGPPATGAGYRLVLPPGWVLIGLRGDVEESVRSAVRGAYGKITDDRRRGLVRRLERAVVESATVARDQGVVDLAMPLGTPWNAPVSVSIAFAPAGGRAGVGPDAPTGPGESLVETRAGTARRSVVHPPAAAAPPEAAAGTTLTDLGATTEVALRTVHHVWDMPDVSDGVLVGTFTVSGRPDPALALIVDALTELADTILASVAWTPATPAPQEASA